MDQMMESKKNASLEVIQKFGPNNLDAINEMLQDVNAGSLNTYRVALVRARSGLNTNLGAQRGVFTCDRNIWEDVALDDLLTREKEYEWDDESPSLRKITLPKSEAGKLLRLLSYYDVTAAELFPGPAGVVRALRQSRWWDQPRS